MVELQKQQQLVDNLSSRWTSHVVKPNFWQKSDLEAANLFQQRYKSCVREADVAIAVGEEFPKLIHFIWLGQKPIPDSFLQVLLPQWREKHAENDGYEIKIWGEEHLASLELTNREVILDKDLNPALRADFLRIELLSQFGGLYADVDMTCEQNVFEGISRRFDCSKFSFVTGLSNTQAFEINNGILLSKPNSSFTSYLIEKLGVSIARER